ncbi:F-box protein At3g44326-like [Vicia villosa]|uniref:F-box protein At3g44326-like n=1 Tax=Vicia villosa TaxID=3911 RepID=UPI00273B7AD4|nr:F-box protein At3g44326-like [Vicia villosa]
MMNNFNKLDPEMIHTHILPRLDGTTLTVLSSVSSEFRHMISKNNELWKNICTSTWPYLHHWNLSQIISTFPHGYCSFFSDAFPSLHHHHHHHNSSYNFQSQSQSQCIDLPPTKDLIYAIDIYLEGEANPMLTSSVRSQEKTFLRLYTNRSHTDSHDYFQENFRLNWIVVDPTGKRAGSLCHSSCKRIRLKKA